MVDCLTQVKRIPEDLHSTSHCLSRPSDTAGLPRTFDWAGSQTFRAGDALGEPGQSGVNLTGRRQT
eukprot:scaffold125047_cov23-Tisochrysis_lutea.AAC.1